MPLLGGGDSSSSSSDVVPTIEEIVKKIKIVLEKLEIDRLEREKLIQSRRTETLTKEVITILSTRLTTSLTLV